MTKYSQMVLWIGLLLITLNLVKNWRLIKGTLFSGTLPGSSQGKNIYHPKNAGQCKKGWKWDASLKACVPDLAASGPLAG